MTTPAYTPTATEIAWAAGLFDGEGSIIDIGRASVQLALGMTDTACVKRFAQIIGLPYSVCVLAHSKKNPNWRDGYYWRIQRAAHVQEALTQLLPYLVSKRERALAAIARVADVQERVASTQPEPLDN